SRTCDLIGKKGRRGVEEKGRKRREIGALIAPSRRAEKLCFSVEPLIFFAATPLLWILLFKTAA
ncbi:MAG: hypothetical protein WBO68_05140, partial [Pyrinomonadaceae bacterium]